MPGYYSGLLEGMMAKKQMEGQQAVIEQRRMKMQQDAMEMEREERERALMAQAFRGSADVRAGLQEEDDLNAQASQIGTLGNRMLRINPELGLKMIDKATDIRQQQSQAQYRNMEIATRKNELVLNTAMTVEDQGSLDDAVRDLAKAGYVVPPNARQWGPEAQDWWGKRANMAKRAIDSLRAQATVQNSVTRAEDLDRKEEKDKIAAQQKDAEAQRKRELSAEQEKRRYLGLKDKAVSPDTKTAADVEISRLSGEAKPVASEADYNALPAGAKFLFNGKVYTKGAK